MVDLTRLLIGIIFGLIAQVGTFFQLQGPMKYEWLKTHYWVNVSLGIPISIFFIYSVQNMILAFGGQMWPSRLIGFSIGAFVFTLLSWQIFNEPLNLKTFVCLMLAFGILMVQLFWK